MISLFTCIFIVLISEVFTVVPKVVILSFNGFNVNYYSETQTPKLYALKSLSTKPDFVQSLFPSKTIVNLFSLSTGVYPNDHGVYDDKMFGDEGKVKHYTKELFQFNENIVPIWIENQKPEIGRHSAVMMWPGGEFEYNEIKPTHIVPYNSKDNDWIKHADTIVNWLTMDDKKANLVMAYFEDIPCHDKNILETQINNYITKVDDTIEKIYTGLKNESDINMIILSDHGTSHVTWDNVMMIELYVENNPKIQTIVSGPLVYIKIEDSMTYATTFNNLTMHSHNEIKFKIYDTIINKFPEYWHMENIPILKNTIILVANIGFTFYKTEEFNDIAKKIGGKTNFVAEENGYDNNTHIMNGFFLAIGPRFKKNHSPRLYFQIIDVYPLLKELLELPGNASAVQNNIKIIYPVNDLLRKIRK